MSPTDQRERAKPAHGRRAVLVAVALLLAALALHGRTDGQRFFVGDEPESLHAFSIDKLAATSREHVLSIPRADGDQPLARVLHRVTRDAFGDDAGAQRFVGAALHALASVFLFLALLRLVSVPIATFAAFAFALHPLTVEPVAWISMHARVLAILFAMVGLLLWGGPRGSLGRKLAFVAFALALLSHPLAAPLPLVFAVVDQTRARGGPGRIGRGFCLTLASALSVAALAIAWRGVDFTALSAGEMLARAPLVVFEQAGRALFPYAVAFGYAPVAGAAVVVAQVLWALAFAVCVRSLVRHRSVIALGAAWFLGAALVGALLPYDRAPGADRDAYFALPGLFVALGATAAALLRRCPPAQSRRLAAVASGVALFALFAWGALGARRADLWRTSEAVLVASIATEPDSAIAHETRGFDLVRRGKLTRAEDEFERALELDPERPQPRVGLAHIHIRRPDFRAAELELAAALATAPQLVSANERMGHALRWQERPDSLERAAEHFGTAARAAPHFADAHARRALLCALLRRADDARAAAERALRIEPESRDAWYALGLVAEQESAFDRAIECYARALATEPDYGDALTRIGTLYSARGDIERAIERLERAYYVRPLDTAPLYPLASAYRAAGRTDEALDFYGRVLDDNPEHMRSLGALAEIWFELGRFDDARAYADRALSINANHAIALEVDARLALRAGEWAHAADALRRTLASNVNNAGVALLLVRVLAAAPDDGVRDGQDAVRRGRNLAQNAGETPEVLSALAAAFAETGEFGRAIDAVQRALEEPGLLRAQLIDELATYRDGKPLRLEAAAE